MEVPKYVLLIVVYANTLAKKEALKQELTGKSAKQFIIYLVFLKSLLVDEE